MRMPYKRSHGVKVERKRKKTQEEKNENARLRKVRFNERKSAARALEALSKHRPLFYFADAQRHGTYGTDNPIVTSMESSIPTARYGVFGAVVLREGDVVNIVVWKAITITNHQWTHHPTQCIEDSIAQMK
ncbi:unnamed protein product [Aphanomyces euteiches]